MFTFFAFSISFIFTLLSFFFQSFLNTPTQNLPQFKMNIYEKNLKFYNH